jgi:two-component system, chemotaxis family, protein-glutamate methylesterase/glutaminase
VESQNKRPVPSQLEAEVAIAKGDNSRMREVMTLGEFTPFTCPECHGVFVKISEGKLTRFRCHTGHAYTLNHLLSEMTQHNEEAISKALRSLEETQLLLGHAHEHLRSSNHPFTETQLVKTVERVKHQTELMKQAIANSPVVSLDLLTMRDEEQTEPPTGE